MTLVSDASPGQRVVETGPAEPQGRRRPRVVLTGVAVAASLAAGIALRLYASSPLWLDEAISVDLARLPIDQIGPALRHDGHPPLYYLLLHGWTNAFGLSDAAVRSLGGVLSIACLPLMWAAGRRLGNRTTALAAVLLLATSPFAVRYATEARMYALVTFLALAGYLLTVRALEAPRPLRLALVVAVTGATLYTHYWGLWLVAAALTVVSVVALRAPPHRGAALRTAGALVVGSLTFVPWVPSLAYQARHTGTPWARSVEPLDAAFDTLLDFGGGKWPGGRLVGPLLALLVVLALLARPIDRWRLEIDLRTVPGARPILAVTAITMALGLLAAVVVSSAFQPRYAAGILPFILLAAAVGIDRLPHPAVRWGVVGILVVGGLAGSLRSATEPRTQAGEVAAAINDGAQAGDVVAFCPDQLRPAVQRELQQRGALPLQSATYPGGNPPGRVDWVDYLDRIDAQQPEAFAADLIRRAGPDHTVWLVASDGYRGFDADCEQIRTELARARGTSPEIVARDADSYERDVLRSYPPR